MGLTKQGQPRQPPLPSAAHRAAQVPYPAASYPHNWGALVPSPTSSDLIAPMSQQTEQVGVPAPSAHHPGARPLGRVSSRPPQQALRVQTEFPEMFMPQPSPPSAGKKAVVSPPSAGKKMVVSPKVQMLKSLPSQLSAGKRFVLKESPPKAHSQVQLFEPVRSKVRDTLAAALSMDCDQQMGQKSAGNVSPLGSAGENRHADSGRMQGITTAFQDAGKDGENVTKVAARTSEHGGNLRPDMTIEVGDAMQQQTEHVPLGNKAWLRWAPDIVVGASRFMSQHNPKRARMSDVHAGVSVSEVGPESKRPITTDETTGEKKVRIHKSQSLASKIEEELFKLFGGVNKKYKEKHRSLLFNLKDKNNPVLRERVLSGDITPKYLCAMTVEELASKELSQWRMARAEELANMVVLPNREVDFRRLVRKTHKGEFQIEVEETDLIEVGLGGESLSYVPSKTIAVQTKSVDKKSVHKEVKESDNSVQDGVAETCNCNTSGIYPANEKSDLMQEPMINDLQVTENLPQIMTLDEFMQVLHSEPHFEDQSAGALQDDPSIDKPDKALKSENFPTTKHKAAASDFHIHSNFPSPQDNCESTLESPMNKSVPILDRVEEPKGDVLVKSHPEKVVAEKPDTVNGSIPESTMQCKMTSDAALTHVSIWEGSIQLSFSTLTNMVAIFKSGEKTSTNEWRRFLEIKGRVRLSDFEEFLEQLPKSRSRAIMVTELRWSGRHHLSQTIDSYIGDERVGLVKLAEGVELYLCPQGKATQVLADRLPKEHLVSLTVAGTSIIGLVVWRRTHVSHRVPNRQDVPKSQATISSSVLPRISQPPSRSSNACRSQQDVPKSQATISSSVLPRISQPPSRSLNASCSHQDVVTADVLPGSSPGAVKDDDDLPEYNFASVSDSSGNVTTSETSRSHQHTSLSEDQLREMIRKYGDSSVAAQPWNRDSDELVSMVRKYGNLPEWNPNSQSDFWQEQIPQPQFPYEQQLRYHSMLQYDMARELQGPLPHAYARHQHFAMPVQHPLTYGHLMQPDHPSYYGLPDHSERCYFGAPDGSRSNDAWNQGLMAWNRW